jgi:putative SOS response-associated peptidase YedK
MCGRYLLDIDLENLEEIYEIVNKASTVFNTSIIYPSQSAPVIIRHHNENRLGNMQWGYSLPNISRPIINSRLESLSTNTYLNHAYHHHRCVVPASLYYEWKGVKPKTPYSIYPSDAPLFSFAGLYFKQNNKLGSPTWCYAIITQPADNPIKEIHPRMPLILDKSSVIPWLEGLEAKDITTPSGGVNFLSGILEKKVIY